jgi:hypothetical protein
MKNLLRVLLLVFITGAIFGWRLAEEKQRRALQAAEDAFAND